MSHQEPDPMLDMAQNGALQYLFPTPVFVHVIKGVAPLNAELRDIILEKERTTPSVSKSNLGGWQSAVDLFEWGAPAVAALRRYLAHAVEVATSRLPIPPDLKIPFDLYAWAAVNRRGHYNSSHVHPGATWSGVYYVDPGDEAPDASGACLELAHPIVASVMNFFPGLLPHALTVRPESGMIILFPSYLVHSVRLYHGERPRICVPFNAHLRQRKA